MRRKNWELIVDLSDGDSVLSWACCQGDHALGCSVCPGAPQLPSSNIDKWGRQVGERQGDEHAPDTESVSHDLHKLGLEPRAHDSNFRSYNECLCATLQATCRLPCTRYEALGSFHSDSSEYIDKCFDSWKTFSQKPETLSAFKGVRASSSNSQCPRETQQRSSLIKSNFIYEYEMNFMNHQRLLTIKKISIIKMVPSGCIKVIEVTGLYQTLTAIQNEKFVSFLTPSPQLSHTCLI